MTQTQLIHSYITLVTTWINEMGCVNEKKKNRKKSIYILNIGHFETEYTIMDNGD